MLAAMETITSEAPVFGSVPTDISDEEFQLSEAICNDNRAISDASGVTNLAKWEHVKEIFDAPDCHLLDHVDFNSIFESDDPIQAEGAAFICDLRNQFFTQLLRVNPIDLNRYAAQRRNGIWLTKFRARVEMFREEASNKGRRLT